MPGWTSPDDVGSILQDMQSRLRRLETYMASPLFASSVLLTQIASANYGIATLPFSTAPVVAHTINFTLAATQTVLAIFQLCFYGSGGTANYTYVQTAIDGANPSGLFTNTNGAGISNATMVTRAPSLAAGAHQWTSLYAMNAGATTTYNELANSALNIFIIGA